MSKENVEVVWCAWDAFLEGVEDGSFAALFDAGLYAPSATLVPTREASGATTYVGRDGFVEWVRTWIEDFRDWRMWPEKIIDAGDDRVVALVRQAAIGKASGVPVDQRFGIVFTLRSGQVIEQRHYIDPAEALEAFGLSEQDAPAAMSRENVELVRRWFALLSASLKQQLAAVPEFWDDDGDYYPVRKWPEAQPCHGREELSRFLAQFGEAFSYSEWAIRWLVAVGDDRVLACANLRAEGRGSGINLDGDIYHCFWLRHGRFFRSEDHLTLGGALHALGLEGETLQAAGLSV